MNLVDTLLAIASVGAGVVGGIFFAFSSFIMRALARVDPGRGIGAMQAINVTVINWHFLGVFFGTALLSLAALWIALANGRSVGLVVAGACLYLVGTILVTILCNVPRNDALAKISEPDSGSVAAWRDYVSSWTIWNHVRTVAAIAAAVCFAIA